MAITAGPFIGHGVTIAFTKSGWTGQLRSISGPDITVDSHDVTHMGTTKPIREFMGGLMDSGEITFEFLLHDDNGLIANHLVADAYATAGGWDDTATKLETVTIDFPHPIGGDTGEDPAQLVVSGFVTNLSFETPLDTLATLSVTFKISGEAVFSGATSLV